jgi:hypothetical protein
MRESKKLSRLKLALPALALAAALGACDQGLTDINVDPNNPTFTKPEYLLAQGITSSVGRALGNNFHMTLTALWSQQFAKIQYIDEDNYDLRDGTINTHWLGFYAGPLQDFQELAAKAEAGNLPNYKGAALTMRSWTFATMTDVWGDIPYSEALRGTEEGGTTAPKYDPQQEIYNGIFAELKTASGSFTAGGELAGDPIYDGDAAAWKKFANSLRLRYAMRLSQVDPAKAKAEFTAVSLADVFTSNEDNATLAYAGIPDNSPIHEFLRTRDDHAISETMVDTLKRLNDPRLEVYAEPNADGVYKGRPNAAPRAPLPQYSRLGSWFVQPNTPALIMTYAEVLFLQAEAAERGWITGSAAALYKAGITASMQLLGVPQAEIDAYLAEPGVQYRGLQSIALQKWIALYGNGPEAYAEWRRTGYPGLKAGPDSVNGDKIPVRVPYPSSEQSLNGKNLKEAIARNGGSTRNDPVWWDK